MLWIGTFQGLTRLEGRQRSLPIASRMASSETRYAHFTRTATAFSGSAPMTAVSIASPMIGSRASRGTRACTTMASFRFWRIPTVLLDGLEPWHLPCQPPRVERLCRGAAPFRHRRRVRPSRRPRERGGERRRPAVRGWSLLTGSCGSRRWVAWLCSNPASDQRAGAAAAAIIEEFRLNGDPVDFDTGISVPRSARTFEIRYTAPSFVKPDRSDFATAWPASRSEWIDAGDRRSASFHGIPRDGIDSR